MKDFILEFTAGLLISQLLLAVGYLKRIAKALEDLVYCDEEEDRKESEVKK